MRSFLQRLALNRPSRLLALAAWLVPAVCLFVCLVRPLRAQTQIPVEYRLKAAFLYNVAKFVEWPPAVLGASDQPLLIGVLGDPAFAGVLRGALEGKQVQGRSISIRLYGSSDEVPPCHILFVGQAVEEQLPGVLGRLGQTSVLTIGETERFLELGGIVNFYIEESRVRFDVNSGHATRSGLKLSSKFLRLARVVSSR